MKPSDVPKAPNPPAGMQSLPLDKLDRKPGNTMHGVMVEHHLSRPGQGNPEVKPKHGGRYEIQDGHHRVEAARRRGEHSIRVNVKP